MPSAVTDKVPSNYQPFVQGAIPIIAGLLLPKFAGSSTLVRGLANGMIASGSATIVTKAIESVKGSDIPSSTGEGSSSTTTGVMMGNVMMAGEDSVLMGATPGYSDYSATSQDFTSAYAGEMDY